MGRQRAMMKFIEDTNHCPEALYGDDDDDGDNDNNLKYSDNGYNNSNLKKKK